MIIPYQIRDGIQTDHGHEKNDKANACTILETKTPITPTQCEDIMQLYIRLSSGAKGN